MPKLVSVGSLVMSGLALVVCAFIYSRVDAQAEAAVRAREDRLISLLVPQIRPIMADFDVAYPDSPRTLEEALGPLFATLHGLNSMGDAP